jgi:hypothetical protein
LASSFFVSALGFFSSLIGGSTFGPQALALIFGFSTSILS